MPKHELMNLRLEVTAHTCDMKHIPMQVEAYGNFNREMLTRVYMALGASLHEEVMKVQYGDAHQSAYEIANDEFHKQMRELVDTQNSYYKEGESES